MSLRCSYALNLLYQPCAETHKSTKKMNVLRLFRIQEIINVLESLENRV